jgi:putative membrane protein
MSQYDEPTTVSRRATLAVLLGAASLFSTSSRAQGSMDFRTAALMGGEFALQTSQLALTRGRNPAVRQFAQLEANEQIAYAAAMGARPGSVGMRPDHEQMLAQLAGLRGSAFDRMYIRGQIAGHNELLQLNQSYSQSGGDPLARAVATLAVPAIQTHLTILARLPRT